MPLAYLILFQTALELFPYLGGKGTEGDGGLMLFQVTDVVIHRIIDGLAKRGEPFDGVEGTHPVDRVEGHLGTVSEIRTEDIREWFQSLPLATKTKNKHKGYANQVFNLAVDFGYATVNPVSRIKPLRKRYSEEDKISILSAEETERLFRAADTRVIPFLTLSFFAGIRRATLERLDWSDVKFDEARVIVPKHKSKNQSRYRVTLSENALEWLAPHLKESGSILVPATAINRAGASFGSPSPTATRSLIKEAAARAEVNIPDNSGRHTFISMHVAHYESIDKTALEADNSPAVIKSNYLDIVTREEAANRQLAIRARLPRRELQPAGLGEAFSENGRAELLERLNYWRIVPA
jgi:integrase